jgi:FkbM family methyltransferase
MKRLAKVISLLRPRANVGSSEERVVRTKIDGKLYSVSSDDDYLDHVEGEFEPELVSFFKSLLQPTDTVLDIGANIGTFSIYASKSRACEVFAFEPSVFNLEFLARNVQMNNLASLVCIVPLAVGEKTQKGLLHMSSTEWGGAMSTFDKKYGYDGKALNQVFEYTTISVSLDDAVSKIGLKMPRYLKIDVDGIEHLILAGGKIVLKQVIGVLIELPGVWREQNELAGEYLREAGLTLVSNHNYDPTLNPNVSANQIWARQ